jgi:predicted lactoylglutathione lyase
MSREIFVNLPVRDLEKTKAFFAKLGFHFNPKFTDQNAACMIVGDKAFVMLLVEPYFKTFTKRAIADTTSTSEAIFALSCTGRDEVDQLVKTALESGGQAAMPPQDHGFQYGHSFYDLDGHHWEVIWMDPAAV